MLIGSYEHTIDPKGRLFIPAKWRTDLVDGFVITKGIRGCLFGLPMKEWLKLSEKLAALPLTNQRAQTIHRELSRWATDCELDKQGRILIPQKLRSFAFIEMDTTLIGMTNHVEIWSSEKLNEQDQEENLNYDDVLKEAEQWGI